jgi:protein-disulfide isomerase
VLVDVPPAQSEELAARRSHGTLDRERFAQCLESGATAISVQRAREEGIRLGVNGTPAFFIGVETTDGEVELVKRINAIRLAGAATTVPGSASVRCVVKGE